MWRGRVEGEVQARLEELEEEKRQAKAKLVEVEARLEAEMARTVALERTKAKMVTEVQELEAALEKSNSIVVGLERKLRAEERRAGEWRCRVEEVMPQLEMAKTEVKERLEELQVLRKGEQLLVEEGSKMRSKMAGLEKEMSELEVQMGHQTRKLEEAERVRRGLEGERREMMVALEEAESELEKTEARVVQAGLDMEQTRVEMERRVAEVEEEAERAAHALLMKLEAANGELTVEQRGRAEQTRARKKLESDLAELEVCLDLAKKQAAEQVVVSKRWEARWGEAQARLEEEVRGGEISREAASQAERRAVALLAELEDAKGSIALSERARKRLEVEAGELGEQVAGLKTALEGQAVVRRRLEEEAGGLQAELEEVAVSRRQLEERWREAASEVSRFRNLSSNLNWEFLGPDTAQKYAHDCDNTNTGWVRGLGQLERQRLQRILEGELLKPRPERRC